MKQIFVNLKRFDIPSAYGGICPSDNPKEWIEYVIDESVKNKLGESTTVEVTLILPESLLIPAIGRLNTYTKEQTTSLFIGSQSVFRNDTAVGGNFGAFSTNIPASIVKSMGCTWTMIGHSEERKDKEEIINAYVNDASQLSEIKKCVDKMLNEEVHRALERDLNVLLCVGETADQKGTGTEEEQQANVKTVLKQQLITGFKGIEQYQKSLKFVIGYEPIWAIGPGKTPPGKEYIAFVSEYIKEVIKEEFDVEMDVIYGGGLKEENAPMIASIDSINGGLVALTVFTMPPAFEPEALKNIIESYK